MTKSRRVKCPACHKLCEEENALLKSAEEYMLLQARIQRLVEGNKKLKEDNEHLKDYKEDIENAVKMSLDEKCTADEKHCTCVPLLRLEVQRLTKQLEQANKAVEAMGKLCKHIHNRRADNTTYMICFDYEQCIKEST